MHMNHLLIRKKGPGTPEGSVWPFLGLSLAPLDTKLTPLGLSLMAQLLHPVRVPAGVH